MNDYLYGYIGLFFGLFSLVEFVSGIALHSTMFSKFTGSTIVTRKMDQKKFNNAVITHFAMGGFFILLEFVIA